MRWDLFCRVVDNHGDLGTCWRLATDLAARGETVRLWVDDASALAWMAPEGAPGVELVAWTAEPPALEPAEVVVEAFGCDPPAAFVARMHRDRPPVWINLEYLSAEAWVERCHGLPSPQSGGPGAGLTKWFFYPGFTEGTGGLLREPGLAARQAAFDRPAWRAAQGVRPGERCLSLFCYANPALPALLDRLADPREPPTLLLATPGPAQSQVQAALGGLDHRGALRVRALPWLPQPAYDDVLWGCDLNFVRGEESFVRAQWAGQAFVWQIYPQDDGAHHTKLDAFLDRFLATATAPTAAAVRALWQAWNRHPGAPGPLPWPARACLDEWGALARTWCEAQWRRTDLTTALLGFVAGRG